MKYLLSIAFFCFGFAALAQNRSGYILVPDEDTTMTVYKGLCTFQDIAQISNFGLPASAGNYAPDTTVIRQLRSRLGTYDLAVFLGTWCSDSHLLIPRLYAVLKQSEFPESRLQLFALDREKKGMNKEERTYGILFVPTIVVMQDGKEIGRITETPQISIEADLLQIAGKK